MPHQANGPSLPGQVAAPGLYLVDQPGMEQADLTAAMLIDAPISPAHSTNAVMMRILGDITSGRLNRDLRDSKQWAYWARGYIEGGRAGQVLLFRTQVQDQRAAEAIAAMKGQLENVKGSKPISPDEMQRAKDALTLSLPVEWETDEGIAKAMATAVRHGLPEGAIEKYVTDVRAVTKEQVEQAARRILQPDAMVWLVIADASEVEPQLRKAGISYRVLTPE
jgi:predicted Zn-dependent peptidase